MEYNVRLETIVASQPTAVVRRTASVWELPKVVPDGCGVAWNAVRAQQIKGAGRNVALYLDDQINLEVGVELSAPVAAHDPLIVSSIPSGTVATAIHLGPYNQLPQAHRAIRDWCAKRGHALAGPNWEIYGHWEDGWKNNPSLIRTDVFYLLKSGAAAV
jgi:effector-binding domain-containing protein